MSTAMVWSGRSATIGGSLRIVAAFIPFTPNNMALELFYAVIDICLLFGLIGLLAGSAGRVAMGGLLIAIIGQASIIGPDAQMFGVDFYLVGTAVLLMGLGITSIAILGSHGSMRAAATAWLMCLLLAIAAVVMGSTGLIAGAGIIFGVGFALAGRTGFRS